ncbi:MAG TPA: hypothetical protein VJP59_10505, partial [Gemmatimonadota bacterium]|nr:hypothetical protein [Gemmatimonadota bacterium]
MALGLVVLAAACGPAPSAVPDPEVPGLPSGPTAAAGAEVYDAEVPIAWFRLAFDLTRDEFLFPPTAARAYAYASVALWEAVAPGVAGGRSLAGQLNGLNDVPAPREELHWPTVANTALAGIMRRFYTSQASLSAIRELEQELNDRFRAETSGAHFGRSVAHGQRVEMAIWQWSRSDGYREFADCVYTAPEGSGLWSPTPPAFEAPVE